MAQDGLGHYLAARQRLDARALKRFDIGRYELDAADRFGQPALAKAGRPVTAMRISAVLVLAWCLLVSAHADFYLRTDEAGVAHYSNLADAPGYTLIAAPVREEAGRNQVRPPPVPAMSLLYTAQIVTAAAEFNVDEALLHAVITAESGYNAGAVSPAGAQGLMQLMPGTAKRYGVADALDAGQNIRGGTRYLRDLLDLFDNDVELAVAAYNAGENAVLKHGRKIPPYRETRAYVAKVQAYYRSFKGTL